jgi:hypothetical protein
VRFALVLLILLCGCSAPKFNRTYRTAPKTVAAPRFLFEAPLALPSVNDEVPPLTVTTNFNSIPPTIIASCHPTNGFFIFEATTNFNDWWRLSEQFSATEWNASTGMIGNSVFIRIRKISP